MSTIAFAFVTFLHNLFTAIWIGGLSRLSSPAQEKFKAGLLFVNIALGFVVLLLNGFSAAVLSVGPWPL